MLVGIIKDQKDCHKRRMSLKNSKNSKYLFLYKTNCIEQFNIYIYRASI